MGRKSKTSMLGVWMNGELVGHWTVKTDGGHSFCYDQHWLDSPAARPLSLSLPLHSPQAPYPHAKVKAYFDNLLPDNEVILERMRQRYSAASVAAFDLLAEAGRDCVGAIQLLPEGEAPEGLRRIEGVPMDEAAIERLLTDTITSGRHQDLDDFRISIAGAQEKTALLMHAGQWFKPVGTTPTTHILKLPISAHGVPGIDLTTSVENEWLCAQILRAYGIPIANTEMAQFGAMKVLVVERFDRRLSRDQSWLIRLPQEDMCQATATPPGRKYENEGGPGIPRIMSLLLGSVTADDDRQDFFRTQVLFWLLCAIDGHAKNFSLFIERGGGYRLTPCYDVLSAYPVLGRGARLLPPEKVKLGMAWLGKNRHYLWQRIRKRHLFNTARLCGITEKGPQIVQELIDRTPQVISQVEALLPVNFPGHVAEPILTGLQQAAQRLDAEAPGDDDLE